MSCHRNLNDQLWIAELNRTFSYTLLAGSVLGIGYRKGTKNDGMWHAFIELNKYGCHWSDPMSQDAAHALAYRFAQQVTEFLGVANPIPVTGPALVRMVTLPHTCYVTVPEEIKRILTVQTVHDAGRDMIILTFNRDAYGRVLERTPIVDGCDAGKAVYDIAVAIDEVQRACGLPRR